MTDSVYPEQIEHHARSLASAIVAYLIDVKSTGHVTPNPPWPKHEVAELLIYTARLLEVVVSVPRPLRAT
jgi:hypothetical protein